MAKRGPKPIEFDLEEVERMAGNGLTQEQICLVLGIHQSTLYRHKAQNKEMRDAIKRGQHKGVRDVANALRDQALEGNTSAAIFYLKNRARDEWQDRRTNEIEGGDISITLNTGVDREKDA